MSINLSIHMRISINKVRLCAQELVNLVSILLVDQLWSLLAQWHDLRYLWVDSTLFCDVISCLVLVVLSLAIIIYIRAAWLILENGFLGQLLPFILHRIAQNLFNDQPKENSVDPVQNPWHWVCTLYKRHHLIYPTKCI